MIAQLGTYFIERDQPPLSSAEAEIVRQFHDLYYRRWQRGNDTINLSYYGYPLLKCPLDLWIFQELLVRTRPDVVIETGTWHGGSALYLATVLDQIGHGRVITIDIEPKPNRPDHARIRYLTGSSIDRAIVEEVRESVGSDRAMVILDGNHYASFVYDEIIAYGPFVHVGDYLIVEDTDVYRIPTAPEYGDGPMEAVTKFLSENEEFESDERCERFLMTLNPKGYLRRKQPTRS